MVDIRKILTELVGQTGEMYIELSKLGWGERFIADYKAKEIVHIKKLIETAVANAAEQIASRMDRPQKERNK